MSAQRERKASRTVRKGRRSKKVKSEQPRSAGIGMRVGLVLILLAVLVITDLVLVRISWTPISRRLLGWGAYPLALGLLISGTAILARDRLSLGLGWEVVVGLEIALVALLGITHRWGDSEAALGWAEQGQGGGIVGWVLSSRLNSWPGPFLGRSLLLVFMALGIWVAWRWSPRGWQENAVTFVSSVLGQLVGGAENVTAEPLPHLLPEKAEARSQKPSGAGQSAGRKRRKPPTGTKKPRKGKPVRDLPRDERLPPLSLLHPDRTKEFGDANADYRAEIIEQTLSEFGVPVRVVDVKKGPTVTRFGVQPLTITRRRADGTVYERKISVKRIVALSNDLALALAATPLRIEAPVPGQPYVGIEVPNDKISLVALRGVMESSEFRRIVAKSNLAVGLGRDVSGEPVVGDLGLMPHLLIAGATGSGKSVCINSIVTCLLLNNTADSLRLLLIDPKMVELPSYNGVPHLLSPVVVELENAVGALTWLTVQMDARYRQFHDVQARSLADFNRLAKRRKNLQPLPHIVLVIDELADMMMAAADNVERSICRLAQMARATGIHLVIATQRPSVDVVTGLIKANFPARIAFAVTSQIDSRVVLDQAGAEQLLGRGDMLFMAPDSSRLVRAQGCFVSAREISAVVNRWRKQGLPTPEDQTDPPWEGLVDSAARGEELFDEAIELVRDHDRVSTSFLQRRLHIGYPRAGRLMEMLEEEGIVGPDERGGRGREVLVGEESGAEGA